MIDTLPAEAGERFERGSFRIRHIRPGSIKGPEADPAFGPFSVMDHADLAVGTVVKMHEHNDDEILSYLWRGTMIHEDSAGHREALTPRRPMMMNAGRGFWHEESTPDEPVEMLQIFFRPRDADLDPRVQFFDRPAAPAPGWTLVAGPEGSGAPLEVRQAARLYDARPAAGETLEAPVVAGLTPWLYVMDGEVSLAGRTLGKGEAASAADEPLPAIRVATGAALVLFLVDAAEEGSRAGTISGR